jgi:hypothetical protein
MAIVLKATDRNDEKLWAGIWLSPQRHDAKVMMRLVFIHLVFSGSFRDFFPVTGLRIYKTREE